MNAEIIKSNHQAILGKLERLKANIPPSPKFVAGLHDADQILARARYKAQVAERNAAIEKYSAAIYRAELKAAYWSDMVRSLYK